MRWAATTAVFAAAGYMAIGTFAFTLIFVVGILRRFRMMSPEGILHAAAGATGIVTGIIAVATRKEDSDYDVRFLYVRPVDWYLSIAEKRDVIERPLTDQLDINGWDLKKALELFRKSNPPLLEWLDSPIIYQEKFTVAAQMRELAKTYYSPSACIYHYLHMAQGNIREYLKGERVWVKKYFYVLRPSCDQMDRTRLWSCTNFFWRIAGEDHFRRRTERQDHCIDRTEEYGR